MKPIRTCALFENDELAWITIGVPGIDLPMIYRDEGAAKSDTMLTNPDLRLIEIREVKRKVKR